MLKPPNWAFTLQRGIGGLITHQQQSLGGPAAPPGGGGGPGGASRTGVLTAGAGSDGKLGQGAISDSPAFAAVSSLAGKQLGRVCCGSYNTVFITERDELFLCGLLLSPKDGSSLAGKHPAKATPPALPPRPRPRPGVKPARPPPQAPASAEAAQQARAQALARQQALVKQQAAAQAQQPAKPQQPSETFSCVPIVYPLPKLGARIRQVALGNYHALLLTDAGKVYAWGSSKFGQLGLGSNLPAAAPEIVTGLSCVCAISCGTTFSAAVTEWGELYTWGDNTMFQLGLGDTEPRQNPTRVNHLKAYTISTVACGSTHTVCLSNASVVFHWGQCSAEGAVQALPNELDLGELVAPPVAVTRVSSGCWHSDFVLNTGSVVEWKLGEAPRKIVGLLQNHSVRAVTAGNFHTLCLTDTGRVFSWGRNNCKQLGRPNVEGSDPLPGEVPGQGGDDGGAVQIAAGEFHSAVLLDNNKRYAIARKLVAQVRDYFRMLVVITRGYMVPLFDRVLGASAAGSEGRSPQPERGTIASLQEQAKKTGRTLSWYLSSRPRTATVTEKEAPLTASRSLKSLWIWSTVDSKASVPVDEFFTEDELRSIFAGMDELVANTAKLLESLDGRIAEWTPSQTMADVFLTDEFLRSFRQYINYADSYTEGQMLLYNAKKRSTLITDTLRDLEGAARVVVMPCPVEIDLKTLLIAPVQFVARLALSLQELAEATDSRHADFALLVMLREKMSLLLDRVNENFQFLNVLDVLHCTADEFGNPQIMGGTVESLVDKLTHHSTSDPMFRDVFLLTFRSFITTHKLLDLIIARYTNSQSSPWAQRQIVFHVLSEWVTSYYKNDFAEDDTLLDDLCNFLERDCASDGEAQNYCTHIMELAEQQSELLQNPEPSPLDPELARSATPHYFTDATPEAAAECLAALDHEYMRRVTLFEFFGKPWEKPDAATRCPALFEFINRFNRMTTWVAAEVSRAGTHGRLTRASVAAYLIAVAERSLAIGNLNAFVAIVYGLSSALEKIRKDFAKDTLAKLDEFERVCSPTRNYKSLRGIQASLRPPCVPFMAIALKDLTFIEDGNPDLLTAAPTQKPSPHPQPQQAPHRANPSGLPSRGGDGAGAGQRPAAAVINFYKRRKFASVVLQLKQYQQVSYTFAERPDPSLWAYLLLLDTAQAAAEPAAKDKEKEKEKEREKRPHSSYMPEMPSGSPPPPGLGRSITPTLGTRPQSQFVKK
eukprot:m51a1_g8777 putative regulator of chromosome condensation domain-containing protein (1223) ;mRNA; r:179806-184617